MTSGFANLQDYVLARVVRLVVRNALWCPVAEARKRRRGEVEQLPSGAPSPTIFC